MRCLSTLLLISMACTTSALCAAPAGYTITHVFSVSEPMPLPLYLLRHQQTLFPTKSRAKRAVSRGEVLVNGSRSRTDSMVQQGDTVQRCVKTHGSAFDPTRFPDQHAKALDMGIAIVYEDDHLAVIHKPPGLPTSGTVEVEKGEGEGVTPTRVATLRTILPFILKPSCAENPLHRPIYVHRLDRPTEGLLVCAKTRIALSGLSLAFSERKVMKRYRALVSGEELPLRGEIATPLDGKPSLTAYAVDGPGTSSLRSGSKVWGVDLYPHTGRTHQLRRHLASVGAPIIGDARHCPQHMLETLVTEEGLFLASLQVNFQHPVSGEDLSLSIEEPQRFRDYRAKEQMAWEDANAGGGTRRAPARS